MVKETSQVDKIISPSTDLNSAILLRKQKIKKANNLPSLLRNLKTEIEKLSYS